MQSFPQSLKRLMDTLGSPHLATTALKEIFIADVREGDDIGISIVSNMAEITDNLCGVDQFVFINRDASLMRVGYGTIEDFDRSGDIVLPVFRLCEFESRGGNGVEIVPRVMLSSSADQWPRMSIEVFSGPAEDPRSVSAEATTILRALHISFIRRDHSYIIPPCVEQTDTGMEREAYRTAVTSALSDMDDRRLTKVVFSRRVRFGMTCEVNGFALLQKVLEETLQSDKGKRFVIGYRDKTGKMFVSVTPERLARVEGRVLETEALAGTCRNEEGFELTEKLDDEHGAVSAFILEKLSQLGSNPVSINNRELVELRDITHCRQRFRMEAECLSGKELLRWASRYLQPTPAVCGIPVEESKKLIASTEGFTRGLFAGVIGFYDPVTESGELAVALRSALVEGSSVHLFAGAGLVKGSVWESEWAEMELKMAQFRNVLLSVRRPVLTTHSFLNATQALCAYAVEELVRQGVTSFIICPGSRSTPLVVALEANSVARSHAIVVHDERSAGFYAVGIAKGCGLPCIIVTSGTAVANLMPAVCEARESRLAILLLTADRPSHSWGVGEYQTIRQHDMFDKFAGFAKNFPAPNSETRKLLANEIVPSILSDIAFGVGEVMKIRRQVVHFNFQFLKPELQPVDLNDGFARDWKELSSQSRHLKKYRNRLIPFTCHVHAKAEGIQVPCSLQNAMHARRCIIVCGELTSPIEAISLSHFCLKWKIPCIAEVTSGMLPSSFVLLGVDQILFDHSIQKALQKHVDVVVRVGGPLISARLQDWSSKTGHSLIRVLDDSFANTRHDPQWSADEYIHIPLGDFLMSCEDCMRRDSSIEPEYEVLSRCEERSRFAYISNAISGAYQSAIAELANHCFNEISIACTLGNKSSVFLSSSMPCRDFAIFGSLNVTPEMQRCGYRLVASNRGANGIDGVVSSAAGFSAATNSQTFLLIGDVSTLHDLSGVAVALNAQPGRTDMRNNVKIVCVNNSGGAIFSFLPIKDHATVFNPFFDTPHSTDLHAIANGIADGSAVQVSSSPALEQALFDSKARFIECINLATHAENVALHKHIASAVIDRLQNLVRT